MELFDEENKERVEFYRLFSSLFSGEPSPEELIEIKEMFQMKFDETPGETAHEFRHLFKEPDGHLLPYESLYRYPLGERPRLWGRVTGEVQEAYRSAGIMIDTEVALIPDHLSVELLFMSYLIEAGKTNDQKRFLGEHLVKWVPDYCEEILKHAKTVFYREVAELLREFVLSDYEEFENGGDR